MCDFNKFKEIIYYLKINAERTFNSIENIAEYDFLVELSLTEINNFAFFTFRFRQAAKKSIFKRCLKLDKDIFHFDEKFLPLFRLSCGFCSPFLQQRSLVLLLHTCYFFTPALCRG